MSASGQLDRECRTFTRFIVGVEPSSYVVGKYREAHRVSPAYVSADPFEVWLVRTAARHRVLTAMADGFAVWFAKRGLLRRKLVLLLAILETSSPSHQDLEPRERAMPITVALLFLWGIRSVTATVAGVAIFLPARLIGWGRRP